MSPSTLPSIGWRAVFASFASVLFAFAALAAEAGGGAATLRDDFGGPLSADWFWGLGTWTAKDGVLRGFESGPRRHGPVKMRKFPFRDGTLECEFRLEGKATFAGIIFNGDQDRGHLFHVVMGRDTLRFLTHPKKDETATLLSESDPLAPEVWHTVKIELTGQKLSVTIDGKTFAAESLCIGEEKLTFGLGGDSGGPDGEKAGALEFRNLQVTKKD